MDYRKSYLGIKKDWGKNIHTSIVEKKPIVLLGNRAFARGVIDAGYHGADGYPGTPSTEVIDTLLASSSEISVGWSVNEAVSLGVGLGYAIAGKDALVCMKIPGVFQAADVLVSTAFSKVASGALVIYAASDYAPSSSQYLIDPRYFFHSLYIPVLEPKNHQELYDSAAVAADLSREQHCPVIILASSLLAHSEAQIFTSRPRKVEPQPLIAGDTLQNIPLPPFARKSYDNAVVNRKSRLEAWAESHSVTEYIPGKGKWGLIAVGAASIILQESLDHWKLNPSLLLLGSSIPLPFKKIEFFIKQTQGPCYIIEEGGSYVEEQLKLKGFPVIGKERFPTITEWTPALIDDYFEAYQIIKPRSLTDKPRTPMTSIKRPPSLCPGCPYKAIGSAITSLKNEGRVSRVFGDIGCSSLLCFDRVFDFSLCMGASDSMRQGFVLARPEEKAKTLSIIGDSSECHSGLTASRNNSFRNIPGVKIILDNESVAMTGGQISPTSRKGPSLDLQKVLEAHGIPAVKIDAYDYQLLRQELVKALDSAAQGVFSAIIVKGSCIKNASLKPSQAIRIDWDLCVNCRKCNICPGIIFSPDSKPSITDKCTQCGEGTPVCMQLCPVHAIKWDLQPKEKPGPQLSSQQGFISRHKNKKTFSFPRQLRLAIRGVGGQGNLFIGKVLSRLMQPVYGSDAKIIKGEVHGMAQKGGSVFSTFACGDLHSPIFCKASVDILIAMERSELLYPGFIELLKPGGQIILNNYMILPKKMNHEDYPSLNDILCPVSTYSVKIIDACSISEAYSNTIILGVLSNYKPYDQIHLEDWFNALAYLSPSEKISQYNQYYFIEGKKL
ncbi:MAG: 2-oxoacid:acceptor oxidoreductase family protein [Spirochaetales bacterium]|nr:2-oxoacid:acceptor oxidoreductase family protein [Spirochaetales bacterium]